VDKKFISLKFIVIKFIDVTNLAVSNCVGEMMIMMMGCERVKINSVEKNKKKKRL
jgi:hypothetical protein